MVKDKVNTTMNLLSSIWLNKKRLLYRVYDVVDRRLYFDIAGRMRLEKYRL